MKPTLQIKKNWSPERGSLCPVTQIETQTRPAPGMCVKAEEAGWKGTPCPLSEGSGKKRHRRLQLSRGIPVSLWVTKRSIFKCFLNIVTPE